MGKTYKYTSSGLGVALVIVLALALIVPAVFLGLRMAQSSKRTIAHVAKTALALGFTNLPRDNIYGTGFQYHPPNCGQDVMVFVPSNDSRAYVLTRSDHKLYVISRKDLNKLNCSTLQPPDY